MTKPLAGYGASTETLKPCPFCGDGDARYRAYVGADGGSVLCTNDSCQTEGPWGETEADADAAWNRRASPPEQGVEGLVHRVRTETLNAMRALHGAPLGVMKDAVEDMTDRLLAALRSRPSEDVEALVESIVVTALAQQHRFSEGAHDGEEPDSGEVTKAILAALAARSQQGATQTREGCDLPTTFTGDTP